MQIETPFGPAWAVVNGEGAITEFGFGTKPRIRERGIPADTFDSLYDSPELARQVAEYFEGSRRTFSLPLAPRGTDFQKQIWAELMKVPFGETITYTELARRVGRERAHRAAGRANSTNRISLIIPCHRVVGLNGQLTGYAYGLNLKKKLLDFERSVLAGGLTMASREVTEALRPAL